MFWILPFLTPLLGLAWFAANILIYKNWKIRPVPRVGRAGQGHDLQSLIQNNFLFIGFTIHLMVGLMLIGADEVGLDISRALGLSNFLNSLRPNLYPDLVIFLLEERFSLVLGPLLAILCKKGWISMQTLFFIGFGITVYTFVLRENISVKDRSIPQTLIYEDFNLGHDGSSRKPESTAFQNYEKKLPEYSNISPDPTNFTPADTGKNEDSDDESSVIEFIFKVIVAILEILV
jgi:hypothetical protein